MKINKICIIGGSGTGKTTLSNNLGKELNLPIYHIDGIHHIENWKIRDKVERDQIIMNIIKKRKWIMDGTYSSTLKERIEKSDLIIFLDYSLLSRLRGIFGRYFKNHGKEKEEIPGCKEQISWKLVTSSLKFKRKLRKKIVKIIKESNHSDILVFKNRKMLNKWYKAQFQKEITL